MIGLKAKNPGNITEKREAIEKENNPDNTSQKRDDIDGE